MTLQRLSLTIFVALQLVLAPLAGLDPCGVAEAFGADSCCCEPVVEVQGCCASGPVESAPSEAPERPGQDCGCTITPAQVPTQPATHALPDSTELPAAWFTEPVLLEGSRPPHRQLEAPRSIPPGRSPLLLHQVFRL